MTPARAASRGTDANVAPQRREATTSIERVTKSIDAAISECGVSAIASLPRVQQAVRMAEGLRALRAALTDDFVREVFLPLQGNRLGFLTDRDRPESGPPGYPIAVVRDCVIVALIHGFNVVGNEFNIITGNFYPTLAGFDRKVREFPGLSHFTEQPGVPTMHREGAGALVPYVASWRLNGRHMSLECIASRDGDVIVDNRIPVAVNRKMGVDAILGKARRKLLCRIYQRLHGGTFGIGETEIGDASAFVTVGEPATATTRAPALAPAADRAPHEPAAPAVDVQALLESLAQVDSEQWSVPGVSGIIEAWTETERREAFEWAMACLTDQPMQLQAARPEHTRRPSTRLGRGDIE